MVMATMSDQEHGMVKMLLEVLAAEFGKGGEAVPEQRVVEALKNNSMDSDRAFAELEEELSRAPWDTIKTKPKQKTEKSSPNGNNNNILVHGQGRGGRGGGGRGRGMDFNGRDDGFRQRPRPDRPEGARAPPGTNRGGAERVERGGGRGGRPNTISRGGPLGEVQATSGPAPADDMQKTIAPVQPVVPLEPVMQRDAPIVANQWSKGRPRTEDEMPKAVAQSVAQAVVEPFLPPPEPTQAPAVAPAWSNAAQSKSILADPNQDGGESDAEIVRRAAPAPTSAAVRSAPPPPAMNQAQDQAASQGSSLQQFTEMHGLDATFATMGFSDVNAATTATQMGMENGVSAAIQQDIGYGANADFSQSHFSAYQQQGSSAGASAPTQQQTSQQVPQQAEVQPAQPPAQQQPVQQQQEPSQQPAQQQMPAPQQPAQQAAQPQQQVASQPQAQGQQAAQQQNGDDMYNSKQTGYGMGYGYGLGADATQDSGANGSRGQGYGARGGRGQQNQAQNQNYMAGMSSMPDQQGFPQWQQQQASMMNWPQYYNMNMAAPQNFMFMQYPGYPTPQMGYNQNYNQQQQPVPQQKGGYNKQHSQKQQGGYNPGYGGGYDQASNAASQDYYKNQGAAAAFQGGAAGFGYPPNVYGGMPGMDSFSQQGQQGYGSMRGSTSASANSSMAGGADMMAAYASGSYMGGYGEQDSKAGWGQ